MGDGTGNAKEPNGELREKVRTMGTEIREFRDEFRAFRDEVTPVLVASREFITTAKGAVEDAAAILRVVRRHWKAILIVVAGLAMGPAGLRAAADYWDGARAAQIEQGE